VKSVVVVGFGLILGLWLLVGYQVTERLTAMERQAADISTSHMLSQELLTAVRTQVLLGSVQVRDALLDDSPGAAGVYEREIETTYRSVDALLEKYVPFVDNDTERKRLDRLRQEIDGFRAEALQVLKTDRSQWATDAPTLLRRLMPRREAAVRVSDEMQNLNRASFVQQQAVMARIHAGIQRQVWNRLGLALAASLGIALLASAYAGRLERRLGEQRARERQHTADLERLSASLVNAQDDERRRLSRELHDEVGQLLSALKVEITLARNRMFAQGGSPAQLDEADALADAALSAIRNISHLLHPSVLDDLGLDAALNSYTAEFGRRHGLAAEFSARGLDGRLPPAIESTAYRIVQAALSNVARHARATSCTVHLERTAGRLVVTVADDGVGFDADEAARHPQRGLGLVGIRERVAQLHGRVVVKSAPLAGTRIVVHLPIPPQPSMPDALEPAREKDAPAPAPTEALHG
jgi:signal transduction histidine kinase